MAEYPIMQTRDGQWRVEVYRRPRTAQFWYRLVHGDNVVEGLSIASLERILTETGIELADLVDAGTPHRDGEHGVA